jgi:DnaJ family protein A protein 5
MQKDNAHLDLDLDDFGRGGITPAEESDYNPVGPAEYVLMDDPVEEIATQTAQLGLDDSVSEAETKTEDVSPKEDTSNSKELTSNEPSDEEDDDEYASRSDIEARLTDLTSTSTSTPQPGTETPDTESAEPQGPKMGAAAKKRARKAATEAEAQQTASDNKCAGCDASFPSKTRLHDHLKKNPKHAALKSISAPGGKRGKRK